ncbi:hypothetical protein JKL49_03515 [Phenylobacterium sp. 20VBR1]|uniref:Uncharacterized protein n=1 Tax=Phenylobacterium glaciei TaxID=2803784 RepID=A0A941CY26_9CAUL|nr:hypothetical protein [Phenylobacterium glaciei]MBR7618447.1 hypothetical protein [Phenylobacterium glaciei]
MLRLILAVILGPLIGLVVLGAIDGAANMIFPPPPGVNLTDPAAIRSATAILPFGAQVGTILAWLLGALAGAWSANLIAGRRALAGRIVSGLFLAFAAWTMATTAYPLWTRVGLIAVLIAAVAADRASGRPRN